ncbi:unnamed protein product [Cladocopium goreaui]|uniref:Regulatory protein FlaEY n=1 Tax=Cladocopium goreaui TaxID=2562237 RepID=A0A9P1D4D0_9DINO|nr:unnamed protein product [Cladocopium goreaui]
MRCDYCPDGKEVADDMVSCKDETFLGLTEIQWAAIGTGLAACSILAGAFLTLCRCCKTDGDKQTPSPSPTTSEIPVVQAVQIGSRPVSEGTSPPTRWSLMSVECPMQPHHRLLRSQTHTHKISLNRWTK